MSDAAIRAGLEMQLQIVTGLTAGMHRACSNMKPANEFGMVHKIKSLGSTALVSEVQVRPHSHADKQASDRQKDERDKTEVCVHY